MSAPLSDTDFICKRIKYDVGNGKYPLQIASSKDLLNESDKKEYFSLAKPSERITRCMAVKSDGSAGDVVGCNKEVYTTKTGVNKPLCWNKAKTSKHGNRNIAIDRLENEPAPSVIPPSSSSVSPEAAAFFSGLGSADIKPIKAEPVPVPFPAPAVFVPTAPPLEAEPSPETEPAASPTYPPSYYADKPATLPTKSGWTSAAREVGAEMGYGLYSGAKNVLAATGKAFTTFTNFMLKKRQDQKVQQEKNRLSNIQKLAQKADAESKKCLEHGERLLKQMNEKDKAFYENAINTHDRLASELNSIDDNVNELEQFQQKVFDTSNDLLKKYHALKSLDKDLENLEQKFSAALLLNNIISKEFDLLDDETKAEQASFVQSFDEQKTAFLDQYEQITVDIDSVFREKENMMNNFFGSMGELQENVAKRISDVQKSLFLVRAASALKPIEPTEEQFQKIKSALAELEKVHAIEDPDGKQFFERFQKLTKSAQEDKAFESLISQLQKKIESTQKKINDLESTGQQLDLATLIFNKLPKDIITLDKLNGHKTTNGQLLELQKALKKRAEGELTNLIYDFRLKQRRRHEENNLTMQRVESSVDEILHLLFSIRNAQTFVPAFNDFKKVEPETEEQKEEWKQIVQFALNKLRDISELLKLRKTEEKLLRNFEDQLPDEIKSLLRNPSEYEKLQKALEPYKKIASEQGIYASARDYYLERYPHRPFKVVESQLSKDIDLLLDDVLKESVTYEEMRYVRRNCFMSVRSVD